MLTGLLSKRARSCFDLLSGIAVADAIGNPLEFQQGITPDDVVRSSMAPVLVVSDDTQMSLFLAEALPYCRRHAPSDIRMQLQRAYLNWYRTQTEEFVPDGEGLLRLPVLWQTQAPGATCMGSLTALSRGVPYRNNSKGNGTVMRCLPIALFASQQGLDLHWGEQVALMDAKITHHHPLAATSSMFLTVLAMMLYSGEDWGYALNFTINRFSRGLHDGEDELVELIDTALNPRKYWDMRYMLRAGVAEQALALAIGAANHFDNYYEAVEKSVSIPGDSDTVGAITGGLCVLRGHLPSEKLVEKLNVLDAIQYVASLYGDIGGS